MKYLVLLAIVGLLSACGLLDKDDPEAAPAEAKTSGENDVDSDAGSQTADGVHERQDEDQQGGAEASQTQVYPVPNAQVKSGERRQRDQLRRAVRYAHPHEQRSQQQPGGLVRLAESGTSVP